MARELFISSYLFIVKCLFSIFSRGELQEKTILIASFGDNIDYVRQEILKKTDDSIVILTTNAARLKFKPSDREKKLSFEVYHPIQFVQSIYHIATAKTIFVDNYFGFLATTSFKKEVKVIQLWHAAGAIKQFGLLDPTIKKRSKRAHKRFRTVYRRFTHVIVGSDKMVSIFKQTFDLSERQLLRTGIPRTDFFFDELAIKKARSKLIHFYPGIKDKKVILYAPTFRDQEIANFNLKLDIDMLREALYDTHIILLRLHPVVRTKSSYENDAFVIDVSNYPNLNELLTISDYLISDYSSIPFEYALLQRPMIFFSYDLDSYIKERGFFEDYHEQMPGPVVTSTKEIIHHIQSNTFDLRQIKSFSDEWNKYSDGKSTTRLINEIYTL